MKKLVLTVLAIAAIGAGVNAQVIFTDDFTYSDGLTTNVAAGVWGKHSGTGTDSFIRNNKLEVFENRLDDVNRAIGGNPPVIFTSFTLNMTNLPTAAGDYFAHYMPATFRCRVFALRGTNIAAANSWRLGLSKSTGSPNKIYPLDLATNVNYRVVISWDTVNQFGTLWVDPVDSNDSNIQPTDAGVAGNINSIAFRQTGPSGTGTTFGRILVDDLIAGNTFADTYDGAVKPATIYYDTIPAISINVGNSTNLSCVAGGAGAVTFQWQRSNTNLIDDANFVGSQSNRLFIVDAIADNSGTFKCIVTSTTNSVVSSTVTSADVSVTVSAAAVPPTIAQNPASITNYFGQTAQFTVVASGVGPFTYAWYRNNSPVSDPNISGDGTDTLTITDVQTNNNTTGTYRCDV